LYFEDLCQRSFRVQHGMVQISPLLLGGEKQKHVSALRFAFAIRLGGFENKQGSNKEFGPKDIFEIVSKKRQ
jgi:hypothetical protein